MFHEHKNSKLNHFSPILKWANFRVLHNPRHLCLKSNTGFGQTICENCGFSTSPSQHFVKCKNGLYIKCRSWWVEQYWYSWLFQLRPSRVPWLWILSKFKIECFKLGQMTHLMTSNETILNTKLLEIMKIYIWNIVHFSIWINFCQS